MKKIVFFASLLLMTACGGRSSGNQEVSDLPPIEVDSTQADTTTNEPVKKISQTEFLESWKNQGVDAFSFDADGYLVYTVAEAELQADPDWVARQYFDIASDVEGIKGCRVVNYADKELGRYEQ